MRWGGLLGEEKCEVEDRKWSVAVVTAVANANPQPPGSIVLNKMHGGRLMREYESIDVASASSSSGNDDDGGISIYNDFDGGNELDGRGEVQTKESTAASCAPPARSRACLPMSPTATMTTTTTMMLRMENPATSMAATG